jgi:hypothetical protein
LVAIASNEPTGSIVRQGTNLEWRQSPDTGYPFAGEQKRFQERMAMEYNSWRDLWAEPFNPLLFAAENRRVRKILVSAHRRAVRTGDWDVFPRLMEGTDRASNVRPNERVTLRPSRRLIVKDAERLNVLHHKTR